MYERVMLETIIQSFNETSRDKKLKRDQKVDKLLSNKEQIISYIDKIIKEAMSE